MIRRTLFLALLMLVINFGSAAAEPTVLYLATKLRVGYDPKFKEQIAGLLPRELARQSLLIAAREELQLATRDQSLRESDVLKGEAISLLLTVDARLSGVCVINIYQHPQGEPVPAKLESPIWTRTLKCEAGSTVTYPSLVPQLEALSRRDFVDLLVKLGAKRPPERQLAEVSGDELADIDAKLDEVDIVQQFLAVRKLHGLMSDAGESPGLLGRLANGYANLGLLTECGWNATSLAMKARAMLYAERLLRNHADFVTVRWHWAYVQAILGIHHSALKQLEDPLPEGVDVGDLPSLPAWADVIEPYCRYDTQELGNLADTGNQWASYLTMWCYYLADEQRKIDEYAEQSVNTCPLAFNLFHHLCHEGSLGIMHRATRASINSMYYASGQAWANNTELPAAVQTAAASPPTEKSPLVGWGEAIKALRTEPHDSDPSWQVLATLLEDTAAMVAASNLYVARAGSTEQSMVPYVDLFMPALEGHPQKGFFLSRKFSVKNEPDKIAEVCQDLRFTDSTLWFNREAYYVWNTQNSFGEKIGYHGYHGAARDFTAVGIFVNSQRSTLSSDFRTMLYKELKKVSPHSPMALASEIKGEKSKAENVKPEVIADWEERAGFSSAAWYELGDFYLKLKDYENACRCYQTSYKLSPTYRSVRDWAWAYEYAKQLDKVVPTLKLYLEEEDHGLGHSNTQYEIARFYLRHNRAEEAKEHALEAAKSWSARGLTIAGNATERLKLVEDAEKWYQALSNAYPSSSGLSWYLWRKRSQSEEPVEEPRKLAQQSLGYDALLECSSSGWWPLLYYLFEDDLERAARFVKLRVEQEPGLYSNMHQLLIALKREDRETAERAKERLRELAKPKEGEEPTWTTRYTQAMLDLLDPEKAENLEGEEVNELLRDQKATIGWCDAAYFVSRISENQDYPRWAKYYGDWAVSFHDHDRITWHLAASESDYLTKKVEESAEESAGNSEPATDEEAEPQDSTDAGSEADAEQTAAD